MTAAVVTRDPFPHIVQQTNRSCADIAWKVGKLALHVLIACSPALVFFLPISFTAAVCMTVAGCLITAMFSALIYFEDSLEPLANTANNEMQAELAPSSTPRLAETSEVQVVSLFPSDSSAIIPGFNNGSGSDCWLNSILQMMFSDSAIASWIADDSMIANLADQTQKKKYETLKKLYQQWKSQIGQSGSAIKGSMELRKFLSPNLQNGQKDAVEGLLALLDQCQASVGIRIQHSRHYNIAEKQPILNAKDGSVVSSPEEVIGIVPLNISSASPSGIALEELCKHNFDQVSTCEEKIRHICEKGWEVEYPVLRETVEILEAPPMLRFCLNRFHSRISRTRGLVGEKTHLPVSLPLDMKLPLSDGSTAEYRLKSFNCHYGRLSGGHYTAYVRRGEQWYLANDSVVTQVTSDQLDTVRQSGEPYLIFYERIDTAEPAPL